MEQDNNHPSIHPLSIPTSPCRVTGGGAGAYLQRSVGERQGIPGQLASPSQGSRETQKTNKHGQTHTYGQFKKTNYLTVMFWTVGGSRSTWREPTHAPGEHVNSMQKDLGFKPRTFLLQGNSVANCATMQL
ncbi:hypothetical protein AMECASPLE_029031 [Ameca splendens]|uniref:Uncharacterized protein n=1 Tax=Ameca splendens TaxID=208324 RepID=A0ABV0XIQ5_9TELE